MGNQQIINQKVAEKFAAELEAKATLAETILKEVLIEYGIDFEFQKPLYSEHTCYIADFYFPQLQLIVELDGSSHKGRKDKDKLRTKRIQKYHNYSVLRFKNKAIFADVVKVVNQIQDWKPKKVKQPQVNIAKAKPKVEKVKQKPNHFWITPYNSSTERNERIRKRLLKTGAM